MNAQTQAQNKSFEIVEVKMSEVVCDGGKQSGHPRVFLHIDEEKGQVVCPYCSCQFVKIS